MDGAQLLGARMLCANLEGASLKGCNFDDPAGSNAIMEGDSKSPYSQIISLYSIYGGKIARILSFCRRKPTQRGAGGQQYG